LNRQTRVAGENQQTEKTNVDRTSPSHGLLLRVRGLYLGGSEAHRKSTAIVSAHPARGNKRPSGAGEIKTQNERLKPALEQRIHQVDAQLAARR
jgi:hypothetical protein